MEKIPVREILIKFAGSLPISDNGIFNIIERLEEASTMPPDVALQAARHPMRAIQAILPDFDLLPPKTLATACGQYQLTDYPQLASAINCQNNWVGETTPKYIRSILHSIAEGEKPDKVLTLHKITEDEKMFLEDLLELETLHNDTIFDRIILIQQEFKGIQKLIEIATALKTTNIKKIIKWNKYTKSVLKELDQF
jgi:hypothetical protein